MNNYLSVILIGGGLFLAILILLTTGPRVSKRLTAIAGAVALIGGLLLYGYGYITTSSTFLQAVLHTVFSVCRMFIGDSDFGDIREAPLFTQHWALTLCWCLHVLAFYSTSSAALSVVGSNALRNLRIRLARSRNLCILYGVTENTVAFGQKLVEDSPELLVYVSEDADAKLSDAITDSGCVLRSDTNALKGNKLFLKSLGYPKKKRELTLYCLHPDYQKNVAYANALRNACQKIGMKPQEITLVIHAQTDLLTGECSDDEVNELRAGKSDYGFGFVSIFQESDLTARLLIQKHPPCNTISFDRQGCAQEDFEVLIVGFGQIGQKVLQSVLMNAQFPGSHFRADVFALDVEETNGFFLNNYVGLLRNYEIHFHPHDGRSQQMYHHLNDRLEKIKYIAICTGNEQLNSEIEEEMRNYLARKGRSISIHQCSYRGIKTTVPVVLEPTARDLVRPDVLKRETEFYSIYHPDVLDSRKLDRLAMAVNSSYMGAFSKGMLEDWMNCDYFSRMSCRAYADFMDAVLKAAGKTEEQALNGEWTFSAAHLENLGRMEHARWNAFHFCMGFLTMSRQEFDIRAEIYRKQKEQHGHAWIRIGKNMAARTHACLVSWEELEELSDRENSITSGKKDYQKMDIDNIMLIPELLRIRDQQKQGK